MRLASPVFALLAAGPAKLIFGQPGLPYGVTHSHFAHVRLSAALRLGTGGAIRNSASRHADTSGRRSALSRRADQLLGRAAGGAGGLAGGRQRLVSDGAPLRPSRPAPTLQALDGADHLCAPHAGL